MTWPLEQREVLRSLRQTQKKEMRYKDATDLICQQAEAYAYLIRRLTPLECERLQGFPDGWTDIPDASDSARYKALGNSVAIPCVEFIISRIAAMLRAA